MLARLALLAAALVAPVLPGCGGDRPSEPPSPPTVSVALDFTPNAVHAPVFAAIRERLDRRHGVRLRIRNPGSHPDSLKLLRAGRVDVGLLDIHDLAIARARGADVVAVGALVRRPLAALLAQPGIDRPRELEGRTVGVSGLPSDPAFLRAMMRHDGGDPRRVRLVTIGFQAVSALLSRRVDAVPAFWNAEGVALRERGKAIEEMRVDEFGAPRYPEVVVLTTPRRLRERRDAIRRALAAIAAGVQSVRARPDAAAREIARAAGDTDVALVRAQLDAVLPAFAPQLALDRRKLEAWARFDARIGIVERAPDVDASFDFTLAPD